MALVIQRYIFLQGMEVSWAQARPKKDEGAIRLEGIASRDRSLAQAAHKSCGFQKASGSYQEMLDDPAIDAIYISLPNNQPSVWSMKSLRAGKHVLLEKPFTPRGEEARRLLVEETHTGKVLMEAMHWQFHPAAHTFRQLVDSEDKYGKGHPNPCTDDHRPRYVMHGSKPEEFLSAIAQPCDKDPRVDAGMNANMIFTRDGGRVFSKVHTSMAPSWVGGVLPRVWEMPSIQVETGKASIYFYNAMTPHLYQYIQIIDNQTGHTEIVKQYDGGPLCGNQETSIGQGGSRSWSTYRYQLEVFIDKCKGRQPPCDLPVKDSVAQMEVIDEIYTKAGMPVGPKSEYSG